MIAQHPRQVAHRTRVDRGECFTLNDGALVVVRGIRDRQPELSGAANGVGDDVGTRLHTRVLVVLWIGLNTYILNAARPPTS